MNCPDAEDYCLIYSAFISYHCIFSQASALTPHLHCIHSHYRQFSRGRLRCCNHEIVLKTGPQRKKRCGPVVFVCQTNSSSPKNSGRWKSGSAQATRFHAR